MNEKLIGIVLQGVSPHARSFTGKALWLAVKVYALVVIVVVPLGIVGLVIASERTEQARLAWIASCMEGHDSTRLLLLCEEQYRRLK